MLELLTQLIKKARELAADNNWGEESLDVNQRILKLDSKVVEAYTRLGKCFKEMNEFDIAFEMYIKALELEPNNTIAKNNIYSINKVLNVEKANPISIKEVTVTDLLKNSRLLFLKEKDIELIEIGKKLGELLIKATAVPQEVNELCQYIISAHLNVDDVFCAIEWTNTLPSNIKGLESIKNKLNKLKEQQRGMKIENINDTYLLINLGKLHREFKAYKKAKIIYLRSLDLAIDDKKRIFSLNGLGGVCRDARWYLDGIEYYNIANKLSLNAYSLTGLGAICRARRQLDLAKNYYNQALDVDYAHVAAHNGLGAVLFDEGYYEEGKKHFELAGDQTSYLFDLYFEYERDHLLEKAIECLNVILIKDPLNTQAKKIYNRITNVSL